MTGSHQQRLSRRLNQGLTWSVIALTGLAGCGLQPHPTLAELKRVPGAELTYPGSVHQVSAQADSNHKFGANAAFFGARGFTNDPPAQVFAYFDQALTDDGWTRNDSLTSRDSAWGVYHAYGLSSRTFAVGIVSADVQAQLSLRDVRYAAYRTVYETLIT